MAHIRDCLPDLKKEINAATERCEAMLVSLGTPVEKTQDVLLELVSQFARDYCATMDPTEKTYKYVKL
jgi:dynamin 1-like protein